MRCVKSVSVIACAVVREGTQRREDAAGDRPGEPGGHEEDGERDAGGDPDGLRDLAALLAEVDGDDEDAPAAAVDRHGDGEVADVAVGGRDVAALRRR